MEGCLPLRVQRNRDDGEQRSSDTIKTSNHPLSRMLEPKCHTNASSKWFLFFRKFSTIFGILYQGILFFSFSQNHDSQRKSTTTKNRQQPSRKNFPENFYQEANNSFNLNTFSDPKFLTLLCSSFISENPTKWLQFSPSEILIKISKCLTILQFRKFQPLF